MMAKVVYPNRRRRQRLYGEFEITLPHHVKGRTKNVSANGASFEIVTYDIDAFCPGTIIPLEITSINITHESNVKNLSLSGKGLIICREVIDDTECCIKLNIAVQFIKKLNFWVPSNN